MTESEYIEQCKISGLQTAIDRIEIMLMRQGGLPERGKLRVELEAILTMAYNAWYADWQKRQK